MADQLLTHARIDDGIQLEALLAVAVEATRIVDTNLITVAGTLVAGALVNVDALVAAPPESHLAADLLRVGRQRVRTHRVAEVSLLHALVTALCVHADHSLATSRFGEAFVNV